jgi:hypothetical protein
MGARRKVLEKSLGDFIRNLRKNVLIPININMRMRHNINQKFNSLNQKAVGENPSI